MSISEQDTADREVVCSRTFNYPRELVFQAWTDPKQMAVWWGPNGFTNTIQEYDPKPGNTLRYTMHAPSGAEFPNESVVDELVAPERVVLHHLGPMHEFWMVMTFEDLGSQTKLTWRQIFLTAEHCAKIKDFITDANGQNFDRLEAHLAKAG